MSEEERVARIKMIREKAGIGLHDARKIVRGEELRKRCEDIQNELQLRDVVLQIIDDLYPSAPDY